MKVYDIFDDCIVKFIEKQKMFFVVLVLFVVDGYINFSFKGYDVFKVIDDIIVVWFDFGGLGIEMQVYVQENGCIIIMFCVFEGLVNILCLFGIGEIVNLYYVEWDEMLGLFLGFECVCGIFKVKLKWIQDSCGWGVFFYEFKGECDQFICYVDNKLIEEWIESCYEKNGESIDGFKGFVWEVS